MKKISEQNSYADQVEEIVDLHFDDVRKHVPEFTNQHLSKFFTLLRRQYGSVKDIPTQSHNILRFIKRRFGIDAEHQRTPSIKKMDSLFREKLYRFSELQERLEGHYNDYMESKGAEITSLIRVDDRMDAKILESEIKKSLRMQKITSCSASAITTIALSLAGGKLYNGLGEAGAVLGAEVAQAIAMNQAGFWGALGYQIFGMPSYFAWVGAGTGLLIVFIMIPFLGALLEFGVKKFRAEKIQNKILESIGNIESEILYGSKHSKGRREDGLLLRAREFEKKANDMFAALKIAVKNYNKSAKSATA